MEMPTLEQFRTEGQQEIEAEKGPEEGGFHFIPFNEYMAGDILPPQYLIKNILEEDVLAVLFGQPGSYKSFIALDWCLSIAARVPWNGNYVKSGPVFSIIGEGQNGYRRRISAWQKANRMYRDIPFFVSEKPAQILDKNSAKVVGEEINKLRGKHGDPQLVKIDTLARNFGPGDENSTKDMNAFIYHLDEHIGKGFTRLVVHHSGLGSKTRTRGSSALKGACDAEYQMSVNNGIISLENTRMKDSGRFKTLRFLPEIIDLGGEIENTSVVLTPAKQQPEVEERLSPQMREALSILDILCRADWQYFCFTEDVYAKSAFYNAINTMESKSIISISDGCITRL